jgi:hypothetical protein
MNMWSLEDRELRLWKWIFKGKTKDRAERKEFARWANLAKETGCRGGKRRMV